MHGKDLREIWRYETGSTGYGCGLKSFTIKRRKITLELFAKCSDDAQRVLSGAGAKFMVEGLTRLEFAYNGKKIVQVKKTFVDTPAQDVKNYQSESSIEN